MAEFLFLYLPILVIIMLNILFFLLTATKISQAHRRMEDSNENPQASKRMRKNKEK